MYVKGFPIFLFEIFRISYFVSRISYMSLKSISYFAVGEPITCPGAHQAVSRPSKQTRTNTNKQAASVSTNGIYVASAYICSCSFAQDSSSNH